MKICFLGTPEFSIPSLDVLSKEHDITCVITKEDKPKGRKNKVDFTPVKKKALDLGLLVLQPKKIKDEDFVNKLKNIEADIFIVIAYGQILSKEILSIPKYGCINIHASLLPKYRGAAPIQWAIINGEKETGITIMQMDEGLDTGDIILKKQININDEETSETLYNKLSVLGADAILETLKKIENNNYNLTPQNDDKASYAPIIKKELGHINWNNKAKDIINLIRGVNPWPSAYNYINEDKMLKIWSASEYKKDYEGKIGEVVDIDYKEGIIVKAQDNCVLLKEIQVTGGKRMNSLDYIRGNNIKNIILK